MAQHRHAFGKPSASPAVRTCTPPSEARNPAVHTSDSELSVGSPFSSHRRSPSQRDDRAYRVAAVLHLSISSRRGPAVFPKSVNYRLDLNQSLPLRRSPIPAIPSSTPDTYGSVMGSYTGADWRELAAAKRASVSSKIPAEWRLPAATTASLSETSTHSVLDVPRLSGLLTPRELELTEAYDATGLVELMSSGAASSVEVVTAFCKRAAIAHQCVNCLTEIMFEEALARAKECDEYFAKEGKPMGPLHGLPISLKVSLHLPFTCWMRARRDSG